MMKISKKKLYYIGSSAILLSIICLIFYLFFINNERGDKDYTIIEKPIEVKSRDRRNSMNYRKRVCKDICKNEICDNYKNQIYIYNSCNICKERGLCWSENNRVCDKCTESEKEISCDKKYGCYRNNRYMKPLNPKFTGCHRCWK